MDTPDTEFSLDQGPRSRSYQFKDNGNFTLIPPWKVNIVIDAKDRQFWLADKDPSDLEKYQRVLTPPRKRKVTLYVDSGDKSTITTQSENAHDQSNDQLVQLNLTLLLPLLCRLYRFIIGRKLRIYVKGMQPLLAEPSGVT